MAITLYLISLPSIKYALLQVLTPFPIDWHVCVLEIAVLAPNEADPDHPGITLLELSNLIIHVLPLCAL